MSTEHKITLHYLDAELSTNNVCHWLMLQTRPIRLDSVHTKMISKLMLRGAVKSFDDEVVPFMLYGSNTLDDWELINYQQCSDGLDIFMTRIIGNYKYFIVVFSAGLNSVIERIDTVYTERFTQTFR